MGERVDDAPARLLAEKQPERGKRAAALASEVVKMGEPELPEPVRDAQKKAAAQFAAAWGPR